MISLNNGWQFTEEWSEDFLLGKGQYEEVRIPHTNRMLPYHSIDSGSYQMVCGYRKTVNSPCDMEGKRAFLQFEGAAHIASVYVNGEEKLTHRCGYTAFRVEITDELRDGKADIAVRLDTTENPQVPPFGFVVDYLTYGGIYRPVWLDITTGHMSKTFSSRLPILRPPWSVSSSEETKREAVGKFPCSIWTEIQYAAQRPMKTGSFLRQKG